MLTLRHVGNCRVRQRQLMSNGIALLFVFHGVTVVVVGSPRQHCGHNQQRDYYASGYAVHVTTNGFALSDSQ
ncbi:hypothetical protein J6Z70_004615 [Salmonella enterica]|uniref:Uncharacterized protein n=1 Tax=Salmonella enterica subsp. enterica serovar Uganda str. R8-3404 TaxID=913083 RepID=A0A6C8H4L0_SALET|nr:hypothetical protein [Salmonella enterica]EBF3836154.1 hypothetical protein [Salmonella enterica subsp. enterica serovar Senftenberg]ECH7855893.1 hypothetical protein [Salmonella enterica subsp. enterica serovar Schwarzengrund]EDJ3961906.1 hypothetical protein [Salmonella enterica subsp. enterica serovar Derby]EDL7398129.1 hypothetical protein [Salmonella enterica subsp. enterica serovar Agona]EDU7813127.1 hypothetical protein [Salmonella enterica subsp. enterica serovar Bredeney]EHC93672.